MMTKDFWKAAGVRALRTVCQTAIAVIGAAQVLEDINWHVVISAALLAGLLSILNSIATGLPEVEYKQNMEMNIPEPAGSYTEKHMTAAELDALRKEIGGEQNV